MFTLILISANFMPFSVPVLDNHMDAARVKFRLPELYVQPGCKSVQLKSILLQFVCFGYHCVA